MATKNKKKRKHKKNKRSAKLYVGLKHDSSREVFRSQSIPTARTHSKQFNAVIGPFKTKRGAEFMRDFGKGNPHCQSVDDAEYLARLHDFATIKQLTKPLPLLLNE